MCFKGILPSTCSTAPSVSIQIGKSTSANRTASTMDPNVVQYNTIQHNTIQYHGPLFERTCVDGGGKGKRGYRCVGEE